jgi:DNA-binding Lrp family transcriptional regulator
MSRWRDDITVHPAADLFPLMGADELRELAVDIKANGLHEKVKIIETPKEQMILIDGRNRLDAMELAGIPIFSRGRTELNPDIAELVPDETDPVSYVIGVNINRRHLTCEQKRDLIAKLMKMAPEKSDRQIAAQTKASPSTVGKVRKELEQTGDVSKLDTRTDTKGRNQPASKPATAVREPVERRPSAKDMLIDAQREIAELRAHNEELAVGVLELGIPRTSLAVIEDDDETVRCSFCGFSCNHVSVMIATSMPDTISHICNLCVSTCVGIIAEHRREKVAQQHADKVKAEALN